MPELLEEVTAWLGYEDQSVPASVWIAVLFIFGVSGAIFWPTNTEAAAASVGGLGLLPPGHRPNLRHRSNGDVRFSQYLWWDTHGALDLGLEQSPRNQGKTRRTPRPKLSQPQLSGIIDRDPTALGHGLTRGFLSG